MKIKLYYMTFNKSDINVIPNKNLDSQQKIKGKN